MGVVEIVRADDDVIQLLNVDLRQNPLPGHSVLLDALHGASCRCRRLGFGRRLHQVLIPVIYVEKVS
jgi:hypothetical protein